MVTRRTRSASRCASSRPSVEPGAERIPDAPDAHAALDLAHHAALFEHHDCGQILDLEVLGELRRLVDIDPSTREYVVVLPLLQHLIEEGLDPTAGAGSRRVEVQQFG